MHLTLVVFMQRKPLLISGKDAEVMMDVIGEELDVPNDPRILEVPLLSSQVLQLRMELADAREESARYAMQWSRGFLQSSATTLLVSQTGQHYVRRDQMPHDLLKVEAILLLELPPEPPHLRCSSKVHPLRQISGPTQCHPCPTHLVAPTWP
jgi:hypothetical protein